MEEMHWHHIVPKHMGGTDDPSNLVHLTRSQHAEEHRKLYEQYGDTKDLWAWKMLSKTMTYEDRCRINSDNRKAWCKANPEKAAKSAAQARSGMTEETRRKIGLAKRGKPAWNSGKKIGPVPNAWRSVVVTERKSGKITTFANVSEARKSYPGVMRILNGERKGRDYTAVYVGG